MIGLTTSSLTLSWTASTDNVGVTGYEVFRNGSLLATVTGTSYTNTGLTMNTTYTYMIRAIDAAGNKSAYSNIVTPKTLFIDTEAPSVPSNLQTTAITKNSLTLSWTASTDNVGVTGYDVYRGDTNAYLTTVTGTSFTSSGLSANSTYSYYIKARDAAGNKSASSALLSDTTKPDYYDIITSDTDGNRYQIFISDIGCISSDAIEARVISFKESKITTYTIIAGNWSATTTTAYYGQDIFAGTAYAKSSNSSGLQSKIVGKSYLSIRTLNLDDIKNNLVHSVLNKLGATIDSFEEEDNYANFIQGIQAGIDDNLLNGILQSTGKLVPDYSEAYFITGKAFSDAAFYGFYTTLSGTAATASAYMLAQAEISVAIGAIADATGILAPIGVTVQVGSLVSFGSSIGFAGTSVALSRMAEKSKGILQATKLAKNRLPTWNAKDFGANMELTYGKQPNRKLYHAHHTLPQKFIETFKKYKFNIHDPKYGSFVEAKKHLSEAYNYNLKWDSWFKNNKYYLDQLLTNNRHSEAQNLILNYARKLCKEFGYKTYY